MLCVQKGEYTTIISEDLEVKAKETIEVDCKNLLSKDWILENETQTNLTFKWLGEFATAPEAPDLYDAYYNTTDGCSYIWNGSDWDILAKDGVVVPEGFVLIPAGTFRMGSYGGSNLDSKDVHDVTITKTFYMGKYEVTQAEYEKYCSYTGTSSPNSDYGVGDKYPAYHVSWYDALVYCNKRSRAEGLTPCYSISDSTDPEDWGEVPTSSNSTWNAVECDWNANGYRLPTEAEWEYAARAGDNTVNSLTYSGTSDVNKLGDYAWHKDNSNGTTHEVGTKLPNAYGLYDMSGNVEEWCWNRWNSRYGTEDYGSDPTGPSVGSDRIYRGGRYWGSTFNRYAVSERGSTYPYLWSGGFRVVRLAN